MTVNGWPKNTNSTVLLLQRGPTGLGRPHTFMDEEILRVPAAGNSYDFTVTVRCEWTDSRRRWGAFCRRIGEFRTQTWIQIDDISRAHLVLISPEQATEAETCLNRALEHFSLDRPDSTLSLRVRARVESDEAVRAEQQKLWREQFSEAASHAQAGRTVKNYRDLIGKWRDLLREIGIDDGETTPPPFIGNFLVDLAANPQNGAKIISSLAQAREQKDKELYKAIEEAIRGMSSTDIDLMALFEGYESALSRLLKWAGLPSLTEPRVPID
ncbi:hypothetical protein MXD62_07070 [Frankia sp. Mgl5]|uniref:hypothetical protein n=1 Tax=Frankia sp. Mgl5 TaxID=2933793 RepID=UPI00201024F3|nr:hypothetical protein [Frankia sp. Mgl5]MCK9926929.1 hypothetical protein [Frankia sp. Mgl5]